MKPLKQACLILGLITVVASQARATDFSVGANPYGIAFDGTSLWVANLGGNNVIKLRPSDGAILGSFPVTGPRQLAFDGANMWVTSVTTGLATRLRASDGANLGTVNVGGSPDCMTFDGENIWVVNEVGSGSVKKIRASDRTILGTFAVGAYPVGITTAGPNIWVNGNDDGQVHKLRASDGQLLGSFPVGSHPQFGLVFDGVNIWVANFGGNSLVKLRESDGANLGTFAVGSGPQGAAFDGANIWVANSFGNSVTKLRASDGVDLGTFAVGNSPTRMVFDGTTSSIWVTNYGSGTVSKLAAPAPAPAGDYIVALPPSGANPAAIVRVDRITAAKTTVASGGLLAGPNGLAVAPSGKIYVADTGLATPRVIEVDAATGAQTLVASGAPMTGAQGIAIEAAGTLVVADGDGGIIRIDPQTHVQTVVSSGGNLLDPAGIAVAADGALVVADVNAFGTPPFNGNTGGAIFRVNAATGAQTTVSSGSPFYDPSDVALDGLGRYIVIDHNSSQGGGDGLGGGRGAVFRIDPATGVKTAITDATTASGAGWIIPRYVAVDASNGDIIVTDSRLQTAASPPGLFRVNPTTGATTLIASFPPPGAISGVAVGTLPAPVDFTIQIDARELTPSTFSIDAGTGRITPELSTQAVHTVDLGGPGTFYLYVINNRFSFTVDAAGAVHLDETVDRFCDFANDTLTVHGVGLTVDATQLATRIFFMRTLTGYLPSRPAAHTFRVIPGRYEFWQENSASFPFDVAAGLAGAEIAAHPDYPDFDMYAQGIGTSTLTVTGLAVRIDPTGLTRPEYNIHAITDPISTVETLRLLPGEYTFMQANFEKSFRFVVATTGVPGQAAITTPAGETDLSRFAVVGLGTLDVVGVAVTVDPTPLTNPTHLVHGVTDNISVVHTVHVIPGQYGFMQANFDHYFPFSVGADEGGLAVITSVDPSFTRYAEVIGASTLRVNGVELTVDPTPLTNPTHLVHGVTDNVSVAHTVRVIPGRYGFMQGNFDHFFPFRVNAGEGGLAVIGYEPDYPEAEAFTDGDGTSTLVVRGFTITVDVSALNLASQVFGIHGVNESPLDARIPQCITGIPGPYVVFRDGGGPDLFGYTLERNGSLTYVPADLGAATLATGCTQLPSTPPAPVITGAWASLRGLEDPYEGTTGVAAIGHELFSLNYDALSDVNTVTIYDPGNDAWSVVPAQPAVSRRAAAVAAVRGRLYVIGGETMLEGTVRTVEEYDPGTQMWTQKEDMPTARYSFAVAVIGDVIYAIGGTSDGSAALSEVEVYNPLSNTWATREPMPLANKGLAAAAADGILYAIGGADDPTAVQAYDPAADEWTAMAALPAPRAYAGAAETGGIIYLVGGVNELDAGTKATHAYSPILDAWTSATPVPTARRDLGVVALDGKIYAMGGRDPDSWSAVSDSDEAFTPAPVPAAALLAELGDSPGLVTYLTGLSGRRVVGYDEGPRSVYYRPLIWDAARPEFPPRVLSGGLESFALAIDETRIVGYFNVPDDPDRFYRPLIWDARDLDAPPTLLADLGFGGYASGVSGRTIIGRCFDASFVAHAVVWDADLPGVAPTPLGGVTAGDLTGGLAVSGARIAGLEIDPVTEIWSALLWDVAALDEPVVFPELIPGGGAVAWSVSGSRVVGDGGDVGSVVRALLWNADEPTQEPFVLADLGGGYASAAAVHGDAIVGSAVEPSTELSHVLLWDAAAPAAAPVSLDSSGNARPIGVNGGLAFGGLYDAALDRERPILWTLPQQANTPPGEQVVVEPGEGTTLTFGEVTSPGTTTVEVSSAGPTPPSGFQALGAFYDIQTTATFSGPVTVSFAYDATGLTTAQEEGLRVLHFEDPDGDGPLEADWIDRTVLPVDTANHVISATVSSLSPFVIVVDAEAPTIACPPDLVVHTDPRSCEATGVTLGTPDAGDGAGGVSLTNDAPAAFPRGTTTVTWVARDGSGNTATCTQQVTVDDAALDEPIGASIEKAAIHFQGANRFAAFQGRLTLSNGDLAPDFRPVPGGAAIGKIRVKIGPELVVYDACAVDFAVTDQDPADDREKWTFRAGPQEKATLRFKDSQEYDAARDPGLPASVGKLSTLFIHTTETRFRMSFKDATLPLAVAVDGCILVTVDANRNVSSPYAKVVRGKTVDVLFPARLVPGSLVQWFPTTSPDAQTAPTYAHEATANGTGTSTYFEAGGVFSLKVPLPEGIDVTFPERSASIELEIGEWGATRVGLAAFAVPSFTVAGSVWKFNDDCDGEDENP